MARMGDRAGARRERHPGGVDCCLIMLNQANLRTPLAHEQKSPANAGYALSCAL